ncbi:MAG TPA: exodeoxyribonuclease VII large subunit [Terriglobia bacterium]|nr:exodeoxyribonuclease VII large subunit [Terriglobia bacterium]
MKSDFQRKVYSVSQIAVEIRDMIERKFLDIWVEGEISNFKSSTAGHLYFTLKDEKAQLPSVCFRNAARLLRFRPENGKTFRARGRITTYEARGEYQLIVEVLEPVGLGALQLAFDQLKEKLQKEGLFNPERKRPIPALPRKVGIVTSRTGAALRDILTVLKRRHNSVHVLIYPCEVQGAGASLQVMEGIDYLSRHSDVDVILVTRGGGSMEDLWPFNEERVARAIIRSQKPVITAIGHEVDFTIADFVADRRAPTPSAAAEIVCQTKEELLRRIQDFSNRLQGSLRYRLRTMRHFLDSKVGSRGFAVAEAQLKRLSQRVDDLGFRLERFGQSGNFARERRHRIEVLKHRMESLMQFRLRRAHEAFGKIAHTLDALSPLAVLERGYAVCLTPQGKVIRSAEAVEVNSSVKVRLHEGTLRATVSGKEL